jgi:hypothetical protein
MQSAAKQKRVIPKNILAAFTQSDPLEGLKFITLLLRTFSVRIAYILFLWYKNLAFMIKAK